MVELDARKEGVLLGVQVSAGASRSRVMGEHGGRLKVSVSAAPERGKANEAVMELVAEALGLRKQDVSIVRGQTSRQKTVLIRRLTPTEISGRLKQLLAR